MNTLVTRTDGKVDLHGLVQAISHATAEDSLNNVLTAEQWDLLAPYLLPVSLPGGQVLFQQGTTDRTLYLLESGSLSVHFEDEKQRLRLAIVGPGSVVGERAHSSRTSRVPPRCRRARPASCGACLRCGSPSCPIASLPWRCTW